MVSVILVNLLVAQLNQAYQHVYTDMQGYARLNRAAVIARGLEHALVLEKLSELAYYKTRRCVTPYAQPLTCCEDERRTKANLIATAGVRPVLIVAMMADVMLEMAS